MFLTVCFLLLKQSEVSNRQAQTYWFRGSNIKQSEEEKKKANICPCNPMQLRCNKYYFLGFLDEYVSGWFWVACVEDPWTVWVLRRCKMTVLQEQCHATIEGTKTDHYFRKLFFQHHEIFKKFVGWTIWLVWIWRKLSVQFVAAAMVYILNGIWRLTEYVWRDLCFKTFPVSWLLIQMEESNAVRCPARKPRMSWHRRPANTLVVLWR